MEFLLMLWWFYADSMNLMGFYGDLMDFMVILSCFMVMLWFQLEFGWNFYGTKKMVRSWWFDPVKMVDFAGHIWQRGLGFFFRHVDQLLGSWLRMGKMVQKLSRIFFGYIQCKSSSLGPYILKKDGALSFWGTTGLLKDKLWEAQKLQLGKTSNFNADTPGLKILRPGELVAGREPQFPLWVPHFFKKSSKK